MSHWPEFVLVAKARRPEPAAGPLGSSPLQAASVASSSTDMAVLTAPPEKGDRRKLARRERVRKRGTHLADVAAARHYWENLTSRRSGMSEPSVRFVPRLQRNIIIPGRCSR